MDYAAEIEQIAAAARHRATALLDEIDEINRQTAYRAAALAIEPTVDLGEHTDEDQAGSPQVEQR